MKMGKPRRNHELCRLCKQSDDEIVSKSRVPRQELRAYEGSHFGIYDWHISNLVIYDKPKQLSDLRLYNTSAVIEHGLPMPTHEIKRPPQGWCYVEES